MSWELVLKSFCVFVVLKRIEIRFCFGGAFVFIYDQRQLIILSKPLLFNSAPQRRRKNISQGHICQEISIETPSKTYVLSDYLHQHRFGQDSTVVLSFQQSPFNGIMCSVYTGASIKKKCWHVIFFCMITPVRMIPTPCIANIGCISCIKPCYFV